MRIELREIEVERSAALRLSGDFGRGPRPRAAWLDTDATQVELDIIPHKVKRRGTPVGYQDLDRHRTGREFGDSHREADPCPRCHMKARRRVVGCELLGRRGSAARRGHLEGVIVDHRPTLHREDHPQPIKVDLLFVLLG